MTEAISPIAIGLLAIALLATLAALIHARRQLFETRHLYLALTAPPGPADAGEPERDDAREDVPAVEDLPDGRDATAGMLPAVNSVLPHNAVYWELDATTGEFAIDRRWLRRIGYRGGATLSSWLDAMARKDSTALQEQMRQLQAGAIERVRVNYRMTDSAGIHFNIETLVDIARTDSQGRALRLKGTHVATPLPVPDDAAVTEPAAGDHELANYLSTVLGYTDLLEKTRTDKDQDFYIDELARAGRRASALLSAKGGETVMAVVDRLAHELDIEAAHYESGSLPTVSASILGHILRPICLMRARNAGRKATLRLVSGEPASGEKIYCSSCGRETGTDCFSILLQDDGDPVLREHLPYVLGRGFDAARITAGEQRADMDVAHAVEVLHEVGGHISLRSRDTETDIRICLPARSDDILEGRP